MNSVEIVEKLLSFVAGNLLGGVPGAKEVTFAVTQLYKVYMEYYNSLTPEQRAEIDAANAKNFDQAGNFNLGSGE